MSYDPLAGPILDYLKESLTNFLRLNGPLQLVQGFEWITEASGDVRKANVEQPFLGALFIRDGKTPSPLYIQAVNAIRQDPIFGNAIDKLIGDEGGQTRFDCDGVFGFIIRGVVRPDGSFSLTRKLVSQRLAEMRRYLSEPIMKSTLIIPLPGIKCYQIPFVIEAGIEIDQLSAKEVGWSVESGALRLFNNDFPFVPTQDRLGLRIQIESARRIIGPEEMQSESIEFLDHVNRERNKPHSFGSVSRWKIDECVEDLLFVLRLARPDFIGTSGAVLVSERPTGRSGTWTNRPTRNFSNVRYEIDRPTGRAIRSYWREMKKQSGKRQHLPAICERRFNAAMDRVSLDDAVVDLLVAAEALFLKDVGSAEDRGELGLRLSLRAANLLGNHPADRLAVFKFMKAAYAERSHIAHGGSFRSTVKVSGRDATLPLNEFVDELSSVMRRAIQKIIPMYGRDASFGTVEFWDSLIIRS